MKPIIGILIAGAALAQAWVPQSSGSNASLRGISVVSADVAWASGTGGAFLRTSDGGKTWRAGSVPGAAALDFRGVQAFSADSAVVMASGEGPKSAVYKTGDGGATWQLLYSNRDAKGFFDAIALPERRVGMILGDPVDGMFTLFRIDREGTVYPRVRMPAALPGEGAFAAGNTSLAIRGRHIWFATGGVGAARVFHSEDGGEHWTVAHTPVRSDADGAGVFSLAFYDLRHGVAVGGNYAKPNEDAHNVALTADGGAAWSEPSGTKPRGYRSAVVWLPRHKLWITTGPTGSEFSRGMGQRWVAFDDGAFNAIGVGPDDTCWAVGPKGRIAKLALQ
jgi:photosystem II stability/assembly factor-like uncharacterized protein